MSEAASAAHAEHFADAETQHHASRLGIWLFLGSEALFVAALLLLYAAERAVDPHGFAVGVDHGKKAIGTANAFILLTSSFIASSGVKLMKDRRNGAAGALAFLTALCGGAFLVLKGIEYAEHVHEGLLPGAFVDPEKGASAFWTLYWVLTLFHAVHLAIGILLMLFFAVRLSLRARAMPPDTAFENVAAFWTFIDIVWVFLWPLFYLMGTT